MQSRLRKVLLLTVIAVAGICGLSPQSLFAQSAAQSKDYWVSFLPSIRPVAPIWLLMCTNVPKTHVTVIYSDDTVNGREDFTIEPNFPKEYAIQMDPSTSSFFRAKPTITEVPQKRSVHIIASNPISMQGFTDADNNVGLFLALPTSSLGQQYVVASFNDQPQVDAGSFNSFDSTGGGFVITSTEDNTLVTIHAHSPTRGGHKAGDTWTVTLNQGETYWVEGAAASEYDDLSQSTVTSSKPVAVTAGCEIMRAWDAMVIHGHFDYNDYIVEQMIPVETWGTDYVSAPFTNKRGTNLDSVGDLYRVYANEPTTITFNGRVMNRGTYWEFPETLDPVHITSEKPVMVVQYDYYYDFHEAFHARTSNSEMVLVPRHNWRKNATFKVPTGYALTYFQVVANKDSIDKITVSIGGGPAMKISDLPPGMKYVVDNYAVRIVQLNKSAQALVSGPCDFAVYNYGTRDNDQIKATYGYAAAAAASFGSLESSRVPRMLKDSACTSFNLTFINPDAAGRGIAEINLLNDPAGLVTGVPYVSTNMRLTVSGYTFGADTVRARVDVINPLLDGYAAVYVSNRGSKDTVYTFSYHAPSLAIKPDSMSFRNVLVGTDSCGTFTLTNTGGSPLTVVGLSTALRDLGRPSDFQMQVGSLPLVLGAGKSATITVCYHPTDIGILHTDTLTITTGCFKTGFAVLRGSGAVPVILATDYDFGTVEVGSTACTSITVSNESKDEPLTLTKAILGTPSILLPSSAFTLDPADLARLPLTLSVKGTAGDRTIMHVCYHPSKKGTDSTVVTWGRTIPSPYQDTIKPWSMLKGVAVEPSLHWDRTQTASTVECTNPDTIVVHLKNSGDGQVTIRDVYVDGADAAEFRLVSVGSQAGNPKFVFPMSPSSQMPVTIAFTPDVTTPNPWRKRVASLHAIENQGGVDTVLNVALNADVIHPNMTLDRPSVDFGELDLNVSSDQTITISNNGTAPVIVGSLTFSDNTHFTRVSGLKVGDTILAGASAPLTVRFNSADGGSFLCAVVCKENSPCGGSITSNQIASATKREVTAIGADYEPTWTCESNVKFVTFYNRGTKPVVLYSAAINAETYRGQSSVNKKDFVFEDPGQNAKLTSNDSVLFLAKGLSVAAQDSVRLPVVYIPSGPDSARAVVTFAYDSMGIGMEVTRGLAARGKNFPVSLSTKDAGNDYVHYVNDVFTIPVSVKENLSSASIYGYDFSVELPIDMFQLIGVSKGDAPYTLNQTVIARPGMDSTYLIHIHASGDSPMSDNMHVLATLQLRTMLSKKLTTPVRLFNDTIIFYHADGSRICYTPESITPATFTQSLICGEPTIHKMLDGGKDGVISAVDGTPNPTRSASTISYKVNADGTTVTVEVFNDLGSRVASLINGEVMNAGDHSVAFDASAVASGNYTVRVIGSGANGTRVLTRRLSVEK